MHKLATAVAMLAILACNTTKNNGQTMSSNDNAPGKGGWAALFDGKTTRGWHTYGKPAAGKAWKVEDGTLRLDARSKKDWQTAEGGDIVTDEEFENFHLKLEWKLSPRGNSGIMFYVHEDTARFAYPWHTGPEMQVLDNGAEGREGHPDAKITSHRAGDLYDLLVSKEAVKPPGEWNKVEIVANNGQLDFYMNGQHTLSTGLWDENWRNMVGRSKFKALPSFGSYKKGRIALQDHGDDVWFRNIMIRRL
ncbi:MAG TPA: DUF1080 domain-containing protein [Flavisolibacter sp.]|nr:DUF1080 domain-containing protein [Flavisolibacter sp.]